MVIIILSVEPSINDFKHSIAMLEKIDFFDKWFIRKNFQIKEVDRRKKRFYNIWLHLGDRGALCELHI